MLTNQYSYYTRKKPSAINSAHSLTWATKGTYSRFNVRVDPLQIDQKDLNTKRMLDLMAVGQGDGPIPLYMHTVKRILREMRILQQATGKGFDYPKFKQRVLDAGLTPTQLEPLKQRLETLESFMPQTQVFAPGKKGKSRSSTGGSEWETVVKCLVHVMSSLYAKIGSPRV